MRIFLLCLAILVGMLFSVVAPAATTITFGPKGLTSLTSGGKEYLQNGDLKVTGAFLRKPDGTVYAADLSNGKLTVNTKLKQVLWSYSWGSVLTGFAAAADRVNISVEIKVNENADALAALYLRYLTVKFPKTPDFINRSFLFYTAANAAHNLGAPGIMDAQFGTGVLSACNEQLQIPLAFGFDAPANAEKTAFPIISFTGRYPGFKDWYPFIDRLIYPGFSDHYRLSLRFGAAGVDPLTLTDDLYQQFAKAYPYQLKWSDRRAIGALFLSSAHDKLENNFPKNPRGWLNNSDIDVTSETGRADFKTRLMSWADGAVNVCKGMNAQGMIAWDPEGQEYPHMTSYLGDPRSLPKEIDPIIDEFFKKFRDAGLRTGICIRPNRPMRPAYSDMVTQLGFTDRRDRFATICEKIDVARKRWDCTIFYFDSDVDFYADPYRIPGTSGTSCTVDDDLLKMLNDKYPDIVIIPEWESLRSYAYAAPYSQLDYNKLLAPPADVLRVYPQAFFTNRVDEAGAKRDKTALIKAVKRGDMLLFSGWWPSGENAVVKSIYEEAGK